MDKISRDSKFLWLLFASLIVGIFEFLSLAGIRLPSPVDSAFFFIFILIVGFRTLWHGLRSLIALNFKNMETLMLIAVSGAWYLEMYEEAAVVIVLYTLAEKLEDLGIQKSQSALDSLLKEIPKDVSIKDRGLIPLEEVDIGDICLIKPGDRISLDGRVISGISFIDESPITGESIPKEKFIGDPVYAGTFNKKGFLEIEVLKQAKESTLSKIELLTQQASTEKAPTQKLIEKFSRWYTPSVLCLAFLWTIIPTLFFGLPFDDWFARGLSLIVIACPCALVISTPISIFSAIGNASKKGAYIKTGKALEELGRLRAMAFDKTGTLTYGSPTVTDIIPFGNSTRQHVLECAAGIELFSEHPLAQSVVEAAKQENLNFHPVENFKSIEGKGAQADCLVCSERHHCLGKINFILEEHQVPNEIRETVDRLLSQGKTAILIATHQEIEGVIAFSDQIRPQSYSLVETIKKMGVTPYLLTGDHSVSAGMVAQQLGIDHYLSDLLPQDKAAEIVKFLKKYGSVGMVGDGINDAPSLALSSVGISFTSLGSDTALDAASIVILNHQLEVIPHLINLGKKTLRTIFFNLSLAISVKFIFIILALMGLSHLAMAIFADVGITLIVILISLCLINYETTTPSHSFSID